MQPVKIKEVGQIRNEEIIKELSCLEDNQVILIFSDGSFTTISDTYEGHLKDNKNGQVISHNPINMNWRPLWVGIRLFNGDMRTIRQLYFQDVKYITHYIQNDIIKK